MKVAFNRITLYEKPGKEVLRQMADQWVTKEVDDMDFMTEVVSGASFCPALTATFRVEENFKELWYIGLDFDDGGVTPQVLDTDPFVQKYGGMAYPTFSSTEAEPRTRLIFFLDEPIRQYANARRAIAAIMHLYGNADEACKDPIRFYFPAGKMGDATFWGKTLPLQRVKEVIQKYEEDLALAEQRKPGRSSVGIPSTGDGGPLLLYWEKRLLSSGKGERNVTLNKASYSLYQLVGEQRLQEDAVERTLLYCGAQIGLDDAEIERTIKSGRKAVLGK